MAKRPLIDDLEGIKLNQEVAMALGWQMFPYLMGGSGPITAEDFSFCPPGVEVFVTEIRPLPDFVGTWEGAGQVMRFLIDRGYEDVALHWNAVKLKWACSIDDGSGDLVWGYHAEQPGAAVARAALKALQ